jgi:hypothetical protein
MNKLEAIEITKQIFASHPTVSKLFVTDDGQAFFEKHAANSHQNSLKVKDAPIEVSKTDEAEEPSEEQKAAEVKIAADKKILDDDIAAQKALADKKAADVKK